MFLNKKETLEFANLKELGILSLAEEENLKLLGYLDLVEEEANNSEDWEFETIEGVFWYHIRNLSVDYEYFDAQGSQGFTIKKIKSGNFVFFLIVNNELILKGSNGSAIAIFRS